MRLAALSNNSQLVVARNSNHMIEIDEPHLVVDMVHRVHTAVRNRTVLAKLEQQRRSRSIILKMSSSWRTGLWLLLLVVAVTLLWVWIASLRNAKTPVARR